MIVASACAGSSAAPRTAARGDIVLAPDTEIVHAQIATHSTLSATLRGAGIAEADVQGIVAAISGVFDPRKLRDGVDWGFERTLDGRVRTLQCDLDLERYVSVVPGSSPHAFAARIVPYDTTTTRSVVAGRIDAEAPSLFAALERSGEQPDLAIALADIFGGEIDFNTELQDGDEFRIVVDKTYRDGRIIKYGVIQAASFGAVGQTYVGVRFTGADGTAGYYDAQGRSLTRFFLRSPLKFDPRITSGFSRARMHPVLHEVRAHLGVDYGAPVGAPVIAVSSGVVINAGWNGGAGRMVGIRHARGYESYYLHLSSIAVRVGAHVSQGAVIGRVGQSGLATGPHLDYRLKKNGVWVNPVAEHHKLPPGEPISADRLSEYHDHCHDMLQLLGQARPDVLAAAAHR